MIDTCDPTIACWSEDGETFVVKDPNKFEQQIIPQFFKHSKFSSFVRVRQNASISGGDSNPGVGFFGNEHRKSHSFSLSLAPPLSVSIPLFSFCSN